MQVLSSGVLRPKSLDVQLVHRGWSDISESIAVLVEREESLLQVTSRAVFTNLVVKLQNLAVMLNFMNIKEIVPALVLESPVGVAIGGIHKLCCLSIVKKETVLDRLRLAVGKFVQVALNWSLKNPNSFWNGKY